jgi:hypothetical protein
MARASIPTLLSLDRFARILGINPVHFGGAVGSTIWPPVGRCSKVWPQHTWQDETDVLSREEVAQAIADAEHDIKRVIGFAAAPTWESEEVHGYTYPPRGWNGTLAYPLRTLWGKVIAGGSRAVTAIDEAVAVVYSDPDGDGYDELATITCATSLTSAREAKLFFAGTDAAPEWEIRPVRSKTISGGTLTVTADAWLFFDPDLWERYPPSGGVPNIDAEDAASYVTTVDVYREYNDTTATSSTFFWQGTSGCLTCGGSGCSVCGLTTQNGCLSVVDANHGVVQPYPATYSADDAVWTWTTPSSCAWPTQVKLSYYAGLISQRYLKGQDNDPLDHYLAQAITWLAVARLDRPLCDCGNANTVARELQRDLTAVTKGNDRYMRFENMDIYTNPFGTRAGEVKAYQRVAHLLGEVILPGIAL